MRIIAGRFKGRTVKAPEGLGTRPTIDRVRESLFSALYSMLGGFEGVHVLDAFAGSGSLGLEALSRGASSCVFCDRDPQAARIIEGTLKSFGLERDEARLVKTDVLKGTLPVSRNAYGLVLLDPPYAQDPHEVVRFLDSLDDAGQLTQDVLITYEHDASDDLRASVNTEGGRWNDFETRKYGKVRIDFIERAGR